VQAYQPLNTSAQNALPIKFAKWGTEFLKAQKLDQIALDESLSTLLLDSNQASLILGLTREDRDSLFGQFKVCALLTLLASMESRNCPRSCWHIVPKDRRPSIWTEYRPYLHRRLERSLTSPNVSGCWGIAQCIPVGFHLCSLRLRDYVISNDVSGALSEFWLGGTSSGNVVMVKLVRRHVGVGDANVSKHVSQEFFFPKAI